MQVRPIFNNFTGGEWTPRLESRIDLAKYGNACKTLENFIIMPHGGVRRRGGFHYAGRTKSEATKSRLIPFEFNVEQAYVLEFGDLYMRVWKNHGQVQDNTADIMLLLHGDGPDMSTNIVDSGPTGHTVTVNGLTNIHTYPSAVKIGSGAINFYADGDYLNIDDHDDFDLSGGTCTIAFWYWPTTALDQETIFWHATADSLNFIRIWQVMSGSELYAQVQIRVAGVYEVVLTTPALTIRGWNHIAFCENANSYYLFLNGSLADSKSSTKRMVDHTSALFIGGNPSTSIKGKIDEFIISNTCYWTTVFTPPTTEYPLPGSSTAVEIITPYYEADLAGIKKVQSADTMYLVHPNYAPQKLTRTSHIDWTIAAIDFIDGPWRDEETTITFTPSAGSGDITLVASANFFQDAHIGSMLRLKFGSATYIYYWTGALPDDTPNWTPTDCTFEYVYDPGNGETGDDYYLKMTQTGGATQTVNRVITGIEVGTVYKVRVAIKNGTGDWSSGVLRVTNNAGTVVLAERHLSSAAAWTEYFLYFKATETDNLMELETALGAGETAFFDTIGVSDATASGDTSWGYVEITAVTDEQNAEATVLGSLGAGDSIAYCEAAWSDIYGWPDSIMFHEDRLWFGRDLTFWGSMKGEGNYENFTPGTTDEDPVSFTVNSDRMNKIRWIASSSSLILGTVGEEFRVQGTDGFITATNVDSKSADTEGVANVDPIKIGPVLLFVQRFGRKIRELVYVENEGWRNPDLTLLAEHITDPSIIAMEFQREPDSLLWALRSDGVLLSMTYLRNEEVVGWASQPTDGEVESIAVIPKPDESGNEIWISVKRTVSGVDYRFIEYLDPDIQVDCGITYSGAAVTSVSGLDHLEGETVKVIGDDMVYSDALVTSGAITLSPDFAASNIQVGLSYTSTLETMRPEVTTSGGTSRGMKKAWGDCFIALYESYGLTINGEVVPFRKAGDALGEAITMFSGDKRVNQLGWDRNEGRILIEQAQALPCTILAIFGDLQVGG
jgi:hypothetical protein